jgi:TRAP-type C4-dicarboxylate transport system permease small subunit
MKWLLVVAGWLDRRFEPLVMVSAYAGFTLIVAVEVVRRFVFREQSTWGAEIAVHLFIWLTWFAAAWGVRNRTHLSFPGVRAKLPRTAQFGLYLFDNVLWLVLGVVVIFGASKMIEMQYMFGSVIQGSSIPMWWSFSVVPLAWSLIFFRVLQNTVLLVRTYRAGKTMVPDLRIRT